MTFSILRHGKTLWSEWRRIQGQIDTPLSKEGMGQTFRVAESLIDMGINRIITSDLIRAAGTGAIIAARLNVPIEHIPELRECSYGRLEGMTVAESSRHYGVGRVRKSKGNPEGNYDLSSFGGENRNQVLQRHLKALDYARSHYQGEHVLLIGHGRGINTLLSALGLRSLWERDRVITFEYPEEEPPMELKESA